MANVNAPFGLRPVKHTGGASWNQKTNVYYIPSGDTNAYIIVTGKQIGRAHV